MEELFELFLNRKKHSFSKTYVFYYGSVCFLGSLCFADRS